MKKREAELQAQVDCGWLPPRPPTLRRTSCTGPGARRAAQVVADKEKRLAKIRAAKAELEAEAKAAAQEERRRRAEAEEKRIAQGRKKNGFAPKPPSAEPDGKAQRNFTDPESRLLLTKDGYIQGWNAQAAVDGTAQVIVAHGLTPSMSDTVSSWGLLTPSRRTSATAERGLRRQRLPERAEPGRARRARRCRLHRDRSRQASRRGQAQDRRRSPRPCDESSSGRLAKPLQAEETDRRAGVRTDQAGTRLPPVPAAGP